MIRINLLPTKEGRKKRTGQRTLAIALALIVLEVILLYGWYGTVDDERTAAAKATADAEARVTKLERAKSELEQRQTEKNALVRQNIFFEQKKHEKTGPPDMLKFLSYVLTKKEDNLYNRDEIKAQEAAGWAPGWDSDQVWITSIKEGQSQPPLKAFTIKGVARSHEDVAEFYRRLESGIYYVVIDPVVQQVTKDEDFDQLENVAFEAYTWVTYNPQGELKMVRSEVPEVLDSLIKKAARAKAAEAGGGGEG